MDWIFHIGPNKTGTTSTQVVLAEQRAGLIQRGALYPATGLVNSAHHMFNFALSVELQGSAPYATALGITEIPSLRDLVSSIRSEASRAKCETVLTSSEIFWTWPARRVERLREALAGDRAVVAAMTRPHLDRELSMWQEEVKHGYVSGARSYLDVYSDTATSASRRVLHERLMVWNQAGFEVRAIEYPRDSGGAIWNVLLEALDLPLLGEDVKRPSLNVSLDYFGAEALRRALALSIERGEMSLTESDKAVPLEEVFSLRERLSVLIGDAARTRFPAHSGLLIEPGFSSLLERRIDDYDDDLHLVRNLDARFHNRWMKSEELQVWEERTKDAERFRAMRDSLDAEVADWVARFFAERRAI